MNDQPSFLYCQGCAYEKWKWAIACIPCTVRLTNTVSQWAQTKNTDRKAYLHGGSGAKWAIQDIIHKINLSGLVSKSMAGQRTAYISLHDYICLKWMCEGSKSLWQLLRQIGGTRATNEWNSGGTGWGKCLRYTAHFIRLLTWWLFGDVFVNSTSD